MSAVDFPFVEVTKEARAHVEAGHTVHQKFTCGGCGQRLTIEEPNKFHVEGTCDQCDHVTDILARGCNYLLIKTFRSNTRH